MRYNDLFSGSDVLELVPGGRVTATGNNTALDLKDYEGQALVIFDYGAGGGTTPTFDLKLQDSPDNSTFTDISGKAVTQITTTASKQLLSLELDGLNRYVRAVRTITGTSPTYDGATLLVARKKIQ